MRYTPTTLPGVFVLEPKVHHDHRGWFMEAFRQNMCLPGEDMFSCVQENHSFSQYGVIRGVHLQIGVHAQRKIVRVVSGNIWDIAVDLRLDSPHFGAFVAVELSAQNRKQLYIPSGFGHGFATLSAHAEVVYKCDSYYEQSAEIGVRYDDPSLAITWNIPHDKILVSQKDAGLLSLDDFRQALTRFSPPSGG